MTALNLILLEEQSDKRKAEKLEDADEAPVAITVTEAIRQINSIPGVNISTKNCGDWLKANGVSKYDRDSWRKKFDSDPPAMRGQPRFVEAGELARAVGQALRSAPQTDDGMNAIGKQIEASRPKRN